MEQRLREPISRPGQLVNLCRSGSRHGRISSSNHALLHICITSVEKSFLDVAFAFRRVCWNWFCFFLSLPRFSDVWDDEITVLFFSREKKTYLPIYLILFRFAYKEKFILQLGVGENVLCIHARSWVLTENVIGSKLIIDVLVFTPSTFFSFVFLFSSFFLFFLIFFLLYCTKRKKRGKSDSALMESSSSSTSCNSVTTTAM